MNWVSPIKDEETLKRFKEALKKEDDKCQFVTFGRIKAIKTSQLKDGRASAEVTFLHFQDEEERTDKVLFVNSKNGKSFLADEIKKVPIGSEVLIAISKWNDAFFATSFATKEGCVRFGDEYVFFGTAHRLPESIGVSTVYAGKTKLHEIENMKMDEPKKELIILAKKNDKIRLSKRGEEIIKVWFFSLIDRISIVFFSHSKAIHDA